MNKGIQGVALLFALAFATAAQAAGTGNINVFLGGKGLDDNDWMADAHSEGGVLIDFGGESWPVSLAVDVLGSRGDYNGYVYFPKSNAIKYYEEDVETSELNLGVRHYWNGLGKMHPYVGGGVAFVHLDATGKVDGVTTLRDSGDGTGLWVGGGIQWRFDQFNLGFSVRASAAEVSLDTGDYQGGGGHTGLLLGYHW